MKRKNKIPFFIGFFIGAFVCYIYLQFSYFETKLELDVPNVLLSIATLLMGWYIAETVQKRMNKTQNQYAYLINKIDAIWVSFSEFSQTLLYNDKVDISSIREFRQKVMHPLTFLKSVFESFQINNTNVNDLETKLDELEKKLPNIGSINNNVVDFSSKKRLIEKDISEINECFSKVLKAIQES